MSIELYPRGFGSQRSKILSQETDKNWCVDFVSNCSYSHSIGNCFNRAFWSKTLIVKFLNDTVKNDSKRKKKKRTTRWTKNYRNSFTEFYRREVYVEQMLDHRKRSLLTMIPFVGKSHLSCVPRNLLGHFNFCCICYLCFCNVGRIESRGAQEET